MTEQNLNLNYILSHCTVKKDLVTGIDRRLCLLVDYFLTPHFVLRRIL